MERNIFRLSMVLYREIRKNRLTHATEVSAELPVRGFVPGEPKKPHNPEKGKCNSIYTIT